MIDNLLDKISDELACNLADLACGFGAANEHQIIDRIHGIDVGLFGRYNDIHTVDFRRKGDLIIIYHIDRNSSSRKREVLNKHLIKQELSKVGIDNVAFND